jgi:hypothetical protein
MPWIRPWRLQRSWRQDWSSQSRHPQCQHQVGRVLAQRPLHALVFEATSYLSNQSATMRAVVKAYSVGFLSFLQRGVRLLLVVASPWGGGGVAVCVGRCPFYCVRRSCPSPDSGPSQVLTAASFWCSEVLLRHRWGQWGPVLAGRRLRRHQVRGCHLLRERSRTNMHSTHGVCFPYS